MDRNTWLNPPPSNPHYLSQTRTGYLDSFCQEGDARHVNPQAHAVNGDGASNYGLPADYGASNYGAYTNQSIVNANENYNYWQNATQQTRTYGTGHDTAETHSLPNDFFGLDFCGPQTGTQEASPENDIAGSSLFHLLNPLPEDGQQSRTLALSPDVPTLPYLPMPCQVLSPSRDKESPSPLTPQCLSPSPAQMPDALDNAWRSSLPPPNPNFFDSEPEEEEDAQHDSALSALLLQQDDDTHLDRQGPNALRQPPTRTTAPKKLTAAQKATQQIKQAAQQEKRQEMLSAADAMMKRHRQEVQQLAQSYGYTGEYLEKLLKTSSHFKGTHRGPQLWNAKLHDKANELESKGIKVSLPELRKLVHEDDKYLNLSKEEGEELLAQLEQSRTQKMKGARLHNKGAALDYRAFIKRLNEDAADLYARTGASLITFAAPSHVSDTFEPAWVATENVACFAQESLHRSMWDIARMLQQWAGVKGKPPAISRAKMQSECSAIINAQLKTVSRNDKAKMNYVDYDTAVIVELGVKLDGWPFPKVMSPFSITSRSELRTLVELLRRGSCRWIRLDATAIREHQKVLDRQGQRVGRKRKERSDKGKIRGSRRNPVADISGESENGDSSYDSDAVALRVSDNDDTQPSTSHTSKRARKTAADITNANPAKRTTTQKAKAPPKKQTGSRKATSRKSKAPTQYRSRSVVSDSDDEVASGSVAVNGST